MKESRMSRYLHQDRGVGDDPGDSGKIHQQSQHVLQLLNQRLLEPLLVLCCRRRLTSEARRGWESAGPQVVTVGRVRWRDRCVGRDRLIPVWLDAAPTLDVKILDKRK